MVSVGVYYYVLHVHHNVQGSVHHIPYAIWDGGLDVLFGVLLCTYALVRSSKRRRCNRCVVPVLGNP